MNQIDQIREEIQRYFNPDNIIGEESLFSPNKKYKVETRSFRQEMPDCNWEVTKVEIYQTDISRQLFSFFVNEGTFFHSWITKNNIDYLLCAEDLCGGQTVIDLTNQKMSSYTVNDDGFIWTKHLLSPDKKLLAVLGCGWGSAYFVIVYHFDDPMQLPLKIAFEPGWTGYDIIEWIDDRKLRVQKTQYEIEILEL